MNRNINFLSGIHLKKTKITLIDTKISQNPDIPLEEILTEDVFLQELKNKNPNLIKYLNKDRVKQMLDYIICEPVNDDPIKGHKLPYVCSQIFSTEADSITKYFFKTNKQLEEEEKNAAKEINKNNEIKNNDEVKTEENKSGENKTEEKKEESNNHVIIRENTNKRKNKKRRRRKKKSKIYEQIIKEKLIFENRIELLDYALDFLMKEGELNYVLCGYFSSLMKNLLNINQPIIISYLFTHRKDCLKKMVYHCYRQSISDVLIKIMQYEGETSDLNIIDYDSARLEILEEAISKMDLRKEEEKLFAISSFIISMASDTNLFEKILENKNIIKSLVINLLKNLDLTKIDIENFIINQRNNLPIIIDIIINWVNSINENKLKTPNFTDNKIEHTLLSESLFDVLPNLIEVNFNKKKDQTLKEKTIMQSYDDYKLTPLGIFRIKIVELIGNLFIYFRNISNIYDKLLIDTKFFENALEYLFEYEFNNFYQDALLLTFKKFLNESQHHEILANHLFKQINILNIIITHLTDTDDINDPKIKFKYKSGNFTNHGYISFLISLSYKINIIIGGDPLKINNTTSREGSISFMTRTAPPVEKEEIDAFYGMDANELYDDVSQDSEEKNKANHPIENMEKYLTDKWSEFFYDHIADKIRLYETKLCKNARRDSVFRNPFLLEDNDVEEKNEKNEDGEEDILSKEVKEVKRRFSQECAIEDFNIEDLMKGEVLTDKNMKGVRASMISKMKVDEVVNESDSDSESDKENDKKNKNEEKNENDKNDNENDKENGDVDIIGMFKKKNLGDEKKDDKNKLDIFNIKNLNKNDKKLNKITLDDVKK